MISAVSICMLGLDQPTAYWSQNFLWASEGFLFMCVKFTHINSLKKKKPPLPQQPTRRALGSETTKTARLSGHVPLSLSWGCLSLLPEGLSCGGHSRGLHVSFQTLTVFELILSP